MNATTQSLTTDRDTPYTERIADIRAALVQRRKDLDISHPDLAKIMDMGRARVINIETSDPLQLRLVSLLRLADALDCDFVMELKPRS